MNTDPMPARFRLLTTRRTGRSLLARPPFWLAVALLLGLAACHDAGLALNRPAVAAEAETPPADAPTADADAAHSDPVAPVLAAIVLMLLLAKVGGDLFERIGQPAVLGELLVGVLLGNFGDLTGSHALDFMQPPIPGEHAAGLSVGSALQILAGIGVVLLLFEVGLESTIREMASVGASSLTVAVLGVVTPALLGYAACRAFFFDSWQQPTFVGATLCATSVGITARVLKDLGRSRDPESRIILGAAVLDDVLGLIVLAVAAGVILSAERTGGHAGVPWGTVVSTILWSAGFLGVAVLLGLLQVPKAVFKAMSTLHGRGLLVAAALTICFGMAWLAHAVGLQPIVGAFAAGLILENAHYHDLERRENVELEEVMHPLTALLVPIFFVQTGMGVKLAAMADPSTWALAATLTVIAVIGKQACSLGVFGKGLNRLAVGLGMIPRGEVGLIFADQGRRLIASGRPVIDDSTFSAIVFMVMITTLVTPPLLKWSLNRGNPRTPDPDSH